MFVNIIDVRLVKKEFGCRICKGMSKNKCWMCGFKRPKKSEMSREEWIQYDNWLLYIKWLEKLFHKLKVENQVSTGHTELDDIVREYFGRWTTKRKYQVVDQDRILPEGEEFTKFSKLLISSVTEVSISEVTRETNHSFTLILDHSNWKVIEETIDELCTELEVTSYKEI